MKLWKRYAPRLITAFVEERHYAAYVHGVDQTIEDEVIADVVGGSWGSLVEEWDEEADVDGVHEGTTPLGRFANTDSTDLVVGANDFEAAVLNGSIGEVKLFRRALDGDEIVTLHKPSKLTN